MNLSRLFLPSLRPGRRPASGHFAARFILTQLPPLLFLALSAQHAHAQSGVPTIDHGNVVTVPGTYPFLNLDNLYVGNDGSGTLNIGAGGVVDLTLTSGYTLGGLKIAVGEMFDDDGFVNLSSGGILRTTNLTVGTWGDGVLTASGGSSVTATGTMIIADVYQADTVSNGWATFSASTLTAGPISIARLNGNTGVLNVIAGSTATASSVELGRNGGDATLTLSGVGTSMTIGDLSGSVDTRVRSTLEIADGALLTTNRFGSPVGPSQLSSGADIDMTTSGDWINSGDFYLVGSPGTELEFAL